MAGSKGIGFFSMVDTVMTGLKLKERWDQYRQLPRDEEGRVALHTTRLEGDTEENEGLLDTEIPAANRNRYTRKKTCCVCCGYDLSLLFKAVGIVFGLVVLYNAFRLIKWAVTPSPTGLEDFPAYSTSLGCLDAPHIYNGSTVSHSTVVTGDSGHVLDLRGGGVGTVVYKTRKSDANSNEIRYDVTIRSTDESLFNQVSFIPIQDNHSLRILTPVPELHSEACSRFDIVVHVPPTLQELALASHATTHVTVDTEGTELNLDKFTVTLFEADTNNQILPRAGLHAKELKLEVFRGWIVGEVSVVESASLKTQQGDGIINVHASALPYPGKGEEVPPVRFRTVSGAGRTDVRFSSDKGFPHRKIEARHLASRNADMYLTYKDAEFNGMVELDSKSYTATGVVKVKGKDGSTESGDTEWTHSVGNPDGGDELYVNTRGWTGLYF